MQPGTCTSCGRDFSSLGRHIAQSDCDYPELTSRQKQIIRGLLMGDGNIDWHNAGHPRFRVGMVIKEFLQWVSTELYNVVNPKPVKVKYESSENQSEMYILRTISHPYFDELLSWYSDSNKLVPIKTPTPMELKMWYVSDGGRMGDRPFIRMDEQQENITAIAAKIAQIGIQPSVVANNCQLNVLRDDEDTFFDYIGAPVPGFEYKWPDRDLSDEQTDLEGE